MPRPKKCRRICVMPKTDRFVPVGQNLNNCELKVILSIDEYEVIRLIDLENFTQEQCANQIDVARTTVTNIYDSARRKIADAIVNGKTMIIEGGDYLICNDFNEGCGYGCKNRGNGGQGNFCPRRNNLNNINKQ